MLKGVEMLDRGCNRIVLDFADLICLLQWNYQLLSTIEQFELLRNRSVGYVVPKIVATGHAVQTWECTSDALMSHEKSQTLFSGKLGKPCTAWCKLIRTRTQLNYVAGLPYRRYPVARSLRIMYLSRGKQCELRSQSTGPVIHCFEQHITRAFATNAFSL